jgi:hypothetical protein
MNAASFFYDVAATTVGLLILTGILVGAQAFQEWRQRRRKPAPNATAYTDMPCSDRIAKLETELGLLSIERARQFARSSQYLRELHLFQGKCAMLRHENNKLRKRLYDREKTEQQ